MLIKETSKKLKEMIRDELKGAKEYKKYGLNKLAEDELGHSRFLKRLYNLHFKSH